MDFNLTESNCISPSKIIPLAIKVVFLSLVHDNVRSQSQTTVINIKPKVVQPGFSPVKKAFLSLIIEIHSNQLVSTKIPSLALLFICQFSVIVIVDFSQSISMTNFIHLAIGSSRRIRLNSRP